MTKLDLYVLEEVCCFLQRRRKENLPVVPISFNVSRLQSLGYTAELDENGRPFKAYGSAAMVVDGEA